MISFHAIWVYADVDWFRGNSTVSEVVKPLKVQSGTSFTVLSTEGLDSSKSPEADPLKTALQM